MVKMQPSADEAGVIFTLSGRIQGDYVAALQRRCALESAGRLLVLEVQEVTLLDRNAVPFRARCEADGRTLAHGPASIRRWIVRERDGKQAVRQQAVRQQAVRQQVVRQQVVRRMKAREET
jgi:hypothetical protein